MDWSRPLRWTALTCTNLPKMCMVHADTAHSNFLYAADCCSVNVTMRALQSFTSAFRTLPLILLQIIFVCINQG